MSQLRQLLVDELQDLLHAETQLTEALPKMAKAAVHPKLKEAFDKHLVETEGQIDRLRMVIELLGEKPAPKPCKGMMGLIKEGEEKTKGGSTQESLSSDLALIAAAQKAEHYEIAAYGTARCLAKQLGEIEGARLLSQSLGEEERADFTLTAISDPLIQQASLDDMGADIKLESAKAIPPSKRTAKGAVA